MEQKKAEEQKNLEICEGEQEARQEQSEERKEEHRRFRGLLERWVRSPIGWNNPRCGAGQQANI